MSLFRPSAAPSQDITHVEQSDQESLNRIARAISGAGLSGPALLMLNVGKPVAWLGGQVLWIMQPLLGTFGIGRTDKFFSLPGLATLLERDGGIGELVASLEAARTGDGT
ncbi:MAG TPA: hypothetical protein VM409_01920 [Chloroflexia bacterium]|nr:hypothetical protein [Chloroflexia bacterium]